MTKYLYTVSLTLIFLSPIFLFRLNNLSEYSLIIYFLIIISGLVSFKLKEVFNKDNLYNIPILLLYSLFAISIQDIRKLFFFLPFIIILSILNYRKNFFFIFIKISLFIFITHTILQKLLDFEFLFILNLNDYRILVPQLRPASIFPFQVYLNQFCITIMMITLILKPKDQKHILCIISFYAGISGSLAMIVSTILVITYLAFFNKNISNKDIAIWVLVILFSSLVLNYYLLNEHHIYNYNFNNLFYSVTYRLYGLEPAKSILNLNSNGIYILLFLLAFVFYLVILHIFELYFLNKMIIIILLSIVLLSMNLNFNSLFATTYLSVIYLAILKFKKEKLE